MKALHFQDDPFEAGLQMMPAFYFFTISVNMFSILFDGSKYLHLHILAWYYAMLISVAIGGIVGAIMFCWGRNFLRRRIYACMYADFRKNYQSIGIYFWLLIYLAISKLGSNSSIVKKSLNLTNQGERVNESFINECEHR